MLPLECRTGSKQGEPYATRTLYGWTINGPVSSKKTTNLKDVTCNFVNNYEDLSHQVERFWKMESFQDNANMLSIEDKDVITLWENTTVKEDHYTLTIPFKSEPPGLANNRSMAEYRLNLLGKRLKKNKNLQQKYTEGIQDLLKRGYAEPVLDANIEGPRGKTWYLPHHPVINLKKPEKVRIVYDCAAKFRGTSLNDTIKQGPNLTNTLIGVLLRFRQGRIALMADVEGMFHQVLVPANQS